MSVSPNLLAQSERLKAAIAEAKIDPLLKEMGNRSIDEALWATNGQDTGDKVQALAVSGFASASLIVQLMTQLPGMLDAILEKHTTGCIWNADNGGSKIATVIRGWVTTVKPVLWPLAAVLIALVIRGDIGQVLELLLSRV